jgi:beta-barrel assembly-enhancing protease
MRRVAEFVLVVLVAAACVPAAEAQGRQRHADVDEIGDRDITRGSWNFFSPEREYELGRQLAAEAAASVLLLRDPLVHAYITDLTDLIVRNSDAVTPVEIYVVDSDELNAFALPGGFFFINTGLILAAETEAELTSVIAHEVAHVAARHGTRQMTKARIWNFASLPLFFFGGPVAYAIHQTAALAVPMTFLKFSRNNEREADFLGLQYHYKAGYDPLAFVDFFERMKALEKRGKDEPGGIARVFSSHPMTRDRVRRAMRTIEQHLPERELYVVNTSGHDEVRNHLRRLLGERLRRSDDEEGPVLRIRTEAAGEDDPFAPR